MLLFKQEIKKELVQYFKNKQKVLPIESKNFLIYNDDIETAYLKIVNFMKLLTKQKTLFVIL